MKEITHDPVAVDHLNELFPNGGSSLKAENGAPPSGGGPGWLQVLNGQKTYRQGGSSNDTEGVRHLQKLLIQIGYGPKNVGNLTQDGIFGATTASAVRRFQTECESLTADGIVGANTAQMLENVQWDEFFRSPDYFPLNASYLTYNTYPNNGDSYGRECSVLVRAIAAEHGYAGQTSQGHYDARCGVAKVMRNRKSNPNIRRANASDFSYRSLYFGPDYSASSSEMSGYLPRGYATYYDMVIIADTIMNGWQLSGAPLVTTQHLYQKGAGAYNASYANRPGFCRYPTTGNQFSFFYIS